MATLKKYDLTGQQIGEVEIDDAFIDVEVNGQMIKDYIVALRANARQWSASTQGRSEVAHSKKKPHRQKGTGRARQGFLGAPQFKGGGVVFGPKPKFNMHVRINRKERRLAILSLIAEKIKEQRVHVLQDDALEVPKTKVVASFLDALNLNKRVLFLGDSKSVEVEVIDGESREISVHCSMHENLVKSLRNIPKVKFSLAKNVNGYELLLAQDLVVTEKSLDELKTWLTRVEG